MDNKYTRYSFLLISLITNSTNTRPMP